MADPEVIHTQMEETRTRLAENLDKLTRQTTEAVQEVAEAVTGTVEEVQETVAAVSETVQDTVSGVKDFLDVPSQVERNPWLMFGGAVALGFGTAYLLAQPRRKRRRAQPQAARSEPQATSNGRTEAPQREPESSSRSWLGGLADTFGPALNKLKGLAIGTAMSMARDTVTQAVSGELADQLRDVIDDVTVNLGGKPVEQETTDQHQDHPQPSATEKGQHHEHRNPAKMDRPVGANPR